MSAAPLAAPKSQMAQEPVRYRARSAGSVNQSTAIAGPCQRVRVGPQPVAASRRRRSANRRSTSQPAGRNRSSSASISISPPMTSAMVRASSPIAILRPGPALNARPSILSAAIVEADYADQGLLLGLDSNAEDAAPPAGAPPPRPPHRCPLHAV